MNFVLPILPAELRVTLVEGEAPVTAAVRPMTPEDLAHLLEVHPPTERGDLPETAIPWLVGRHLVRIEGLELQGADGTSVPFDATNRVHRDNLPYTWCRKLFVALQERARISERTAGNFEGPSDSPGTSDGAA